MSRSNEITIQIIQKPIMPFGSNEMNCILEQHISLFPNGLDKFWLDVISNDMGEIFCDWLMSTL